MKRIIASLLSAALLSASMFACADKTSSGDETAKTDTSAVTENETGESETETITYTADIPEGTDYGGATLTVYTYPDSSSGQYWVDVDFCSTGENGETINDATYTRLRAAEEKLGVDITSFAPTDTTGTVLRKSVAANDGAYDFAFINANATGALIENGLIINIRNLTELDLDAAWWDQNVISGLSVANKVYMLAGDISIMPKKTVRVIYFNKSLAGDYDIPNPYELVDGMTWTIDNLASIARTVSDDLNGDGVMDKNDRFGMLFRSNSIYPMLIGAGVTCAAKDSDDMPVLSFYNADTQNAWEKLTGLLYDKSCCFSQDGPGGVEVVPMFVSNQGLFMSVELHNVQLMREMVDDFGILPNPLLDESQESYYSTINPNVAAMLVIPADCPDTERTAYVLDVLGSESKNALTPAYIETYLKGKVTRDSESETTLNIIFNNIRYDIGHCYNWGSIGQFAEAVFGAYKDDLASAYAKIETSSQRALDKSISAYLEKAN